MISFSTSLNLTRTNPATHIQACNTFDIQDSAADFEQVNDGKHALRLNSQKKVSNLIVQDLMRKHRAVEYGLNYSNRTDRSIVRCVSILDSVVSFWNEEGECCPLVQTFLLLGMEVYLNLNKKFI